MLIQVIGAFFSVVAFSFLLHVPRKYIIWAGFTGAVGWWIYLVLMDLQFSMAVATFLSGCLISLCGQFFARILKTPVTIFVIPGILPLVPGAGMFRIAHSVIRSDGLTSYYIIQTLIVAGMIALSIMVVDSIFRLFLKTKGDCHVDRR